MLDVITLSNTYTFGRTPWMRNWTVAKLLLLQHTK